MTHNLGLYKSNRHLVFTYLHFIIQTSGSLLSCKIENKMKVGIYKNRKQKSNIAYKMVSERYLKNQRKSIHFYPAQHHYTHLEDNRVKTYYFYPELTSASSSPSHTSLCLFSQVSLIFLHLLRRGCLSQMSSWSFKRWKWRTGREWMKDRGFMQNGDKAYTQVKMM